MTPREISDLMQAQAEREMDEWKKQKWVVYHTAALIRAEDMPTFADFMKDAPAEKAQKKEKTPEDLRREYEEIKNIFD